MTASRIETVDTTNLERLTAMLRSGKISTVNPLFGNSRWMDDDIRSYWPLRVGDTVCVTADTTISDADGKQLPSVYRVKITESNAEEWRTRLRARKEDIRVHHRLSKVEGKIGVIGWKYHESGIQIGDQILVAQPGLVIEASWFVSSEWEDESDDD